MNFLYNEKQELFKDMIESFAKNEIEPIAEHNDKIGKFPRELINKMGKSGLMGMIIPKEFGGQGADTVAYSMGIAEVSRACAATGTIMAVHSMSMTPILKFGTEEQKKKYLPKMASGEHIGAFALTEPSAGSDAAAVSTVAVYDEKTEEYVLNGTKMFITNAGEAGVYTVVAMTDKSKGVKGLTAFIIEAGTEGFSTGKLEEKMGIKASATAELIFENCRIPKANLLGKEGQGFKIAMVGLDDGRIGIASQSWGIAQAALDAAVGYSKERKQFGKPICKNQAIQFLLADMRCKVEIAKLLTLQASSLKDQKKPFSIEGSIAKYQSSEIAVEVANNALQIAGGYGFMKEYIFERLVRDARITTIYEGTSQIMQMVIGRDVLK
ncbi:acyl-CoA dehydrogenase family protein (plasmid) [Fusobacteria bacterium ZRK30]|nr:acyl-CoA dehydrogenase family protein [Fusobacteria bacterium ZRK30]